MNIRWDTIECVFVAEFSSDFNGDLEAVKEAGFKPLGTPPPWIWHAPSPGIKALNRLREKRPASGLTITSEARAIYQPLAEQEAKNAELKAQLAEHNKALKKKLKIKEQEGKAFVIPEKGYIDASDLPPMPPHENTYKPPAPPAILCIICKAPVYFYELQSPPTCLFCEKNVLDNAIQVC